MILCRQVLKLSAKRQKNVCDAPEEKSFTRKRNENLILRFIFTGQSHVKAVEIVAVFLFDLDITGLIILNLGYDVFQLAVFFVRSVFAQFILSADQCSNPFFCNEVADKAVNELERIQVYLVVAADGHLLEFLQLDINLVIDLALDV